jgi:hypothetical protein
MGSNTRPRNKYTKQLREPVGVDKPCDECTWWDRRGNCVLCGTPKKPNPDYHAPPPVMEMRRLPPDPSHKLTDNELALRNRRTR